MRHSNSLILLVALLTLSSPAFGGPTRQRLLTSNPEPYVGQALILTLEIQRSDRAARLNINWPPLENLVLLETLPSNVRRLDDDPGQLVESLRRLVRPLRPGPLVLALKPVGPGNNKQTNALQLHVRPLPRQRRPQQFSGMVGTLDWQLDDPRGDGRRQVSLQLHGDAALELIREPLRCEEGGILTLLDLQRQGKGTGQTLRRRYLYNPKDGDKGNLRVVLNWFDPETGHYQSSRPPTKMSRWVILTLVAGGLVPLPILLALRQRRRGERVSSILKESGQLENRRQRCQKLRQAGATDELLFELNHYWRQHDLHFSTPHRLPTPAGPSRRLARELGKLIDKIDKP